MMGPKCVTAEDYQKYLLTIACPRNRALPGRTEVTSPMERTSLGIDCDEVLPGIIIAAGSTLFNIYAWDQPEELGGTESLIASMVTASTMVTSKWGDEHMFFRHQRMDDDLKIRPEWEPYTPIFKVFGEDDGYLPDIAAKVVSACPFAYLFQ